MEFLNDNINCSTNTIYNLITGSALRYQKIIKRYTKLKFLLYFWWILIRYLSTGVLLVVMIVSSLRNFFGNTSAVEIGVSTLIVSLIVLVIIYNLVANIKSFLDGYFI